MTLDQMCLLQVYFPGLWLVFSVPFPELKLLISMKSSLSIIPFMDGAFGVGSQKSSPHPRSSRFFSFVLV